MRNQKAENEVVFYLIPLQRHQIVALKGSRFEILNGHSNNAHSVSHAELGHLMLNQ